MYHQGVPCLPRRLCPPPPQIQMLAGIYSSRTALTQSSLHDNHFLLLNIVAWRRGIQRICNFNVASNINNMPLYFFEILSWLVSFVNLMYSCQKSFLTGLAISCFVEWPGRIWSIICFFEINNKMKDLKIYIKRWSKKNKVFLF